MDITPQQILILDRLRSRDFQIVAFPMYANHIGVRKGNCAALLAPVPGNGFTIYGTPAYLLGGNLTVRVAHEGRDWFVWKKEKLEATAARVAELHAFIVDLSESLLPMI